MTPRKNGNVQREDETPKPEEQQAEKSGQEFDEGDVVALTNQALRMGRLEAMTPRVLYQIGHPNEFLVMTTFETEEDGLCLKLYPCCGIYKRDHRKDDPRCKGHPAVYFKKIDVFRLPKKGDKSSSLFLPFFPGEVAGIHWEEDEDNPRLTLNLFGVKLGGTGALGKFFKNLAESGKLI